MSDRPLNPPDWLILFGAAVGLVLLIGLPVLGIYYLVDGRVSLAVVCLAAWGAMVVGLFLLRVRAKRAKATEEKERLALRRRDGIDTRDESYKVADLSEWDTAWNWRRDGYVDWLEGEVQELQEGDIVLSYLSGWGMAIRAGYAIERNGVIVAQVVTFMS